MKAKQFHEMNTEELKAKLKELKQELFNLRFQHATGQFQSYERSIPVKRYKGF